MDALAVNYSPQIIAMLLSLPISDILRIVSMDKMISRIESAQSFVKVPVLAPASSSSPQTSSATQSQSLVSSAPSTLLTTPTTLSPPDTNPGYSQDKNVVTYSFDLHVVTVSLYRPESTLLSSSSHPPPTTRSPSGGLRLTPIGPFVCQPLLSLSITDITAQIDDKARSYSLPPLSPSSPSLSSPEQLPVLTASLGLTATIGSIHIADLRTQGSSAPISPSKPAQDLLVPYKKVNVDSYISGSRGHDTLVFMRLSKEKYLVRQVSPINTSSNSLPGIASPTSPQPLSVGNPLLHSIDEIRILGRVGGLQLYLQPEVLVMISNYVSTCVLDVLIPFLTSLATDDLTGDDTYPTSSTSPSTSSPSSSSVSSDSTSSQSLPALPTLLSVDVAIDPTVVVLPIATTASEAPHSSISLPTSFPSSSSSSSSSHASLAAYNANRNTSSSLNILSSPRPLGESIIATLGRVVVSTSGIPQPQRGSLTPAHTRATTTSTTETLVSSSVLPPPPLLKQWLQTIFASEAIKAKKTSRAFSSLGGQDASSPPLLSTGPSLLVSSIDLNDTNTSSPVLRSNVPGSPSIDSLPHSMPSPSKSAQSLSSSDASNTLPLSLKDRLVDSINEWLCFSARLSDVGVLVCDNPSEYLRIVTASLAQGNLSDHASSGHHDDDDTSGYSAEDSAWLSAHTSSIIDRCDAKAIIVVPKQEGASQVDISTTSPSSTPTSSPTSSPTASTPSETRSDFTRGTFVYLASAGVNVRLLPEHIETFNRLYMNNRGYLSGAPTTDPELQRHFTKPVPLVTCPSFKLIASPPNNLLPAACIGQLSSSTATRQDPHLVTEYYADLPVYSEYPLFAFLASANPTSIRTSRGNLSSLTLAVLTSTTSSSGPTLTSPTLLLSPSVFIDETSISNMIGDEPNQASVTSSPALPTSSTSARTRSSLSLTLSSPLVFFAHVDHFTATLVTASSSSHDGTPATESGHSTSSLGSPFATLMLSSLSITHVGVSVDASLDTSLPNLRSSASRSQLSVGNVQLFDLRKDDNTTTLSSSGSDKSPINPFKQVFGRFESLLRGVETSTQSVATTSSLSSAGLSARGPTLPHVETYHQPLIEVSLTQLPRDPTTALTRIQTGLAVGAEGVLRRKAARLLMTRPSTLTDIVLNVQPISLLFLPSFVYQLVGYATGILTTLTSVINDESAVTTQEEDAEPTHEREPPSTQSLAQGTKDPAISVNGSDDNNSDVKNNSASGSVGGVTNAFNLTLPKTPHEIPLTYALPSLVNVSASVGKLIALLPCIDPDYLIPGKSLLKNIGIPPQSKSTSGSTSAKTSNLNKYATTKGNLGIRLDNHVSYLSLPLAALTLEPAVSISIFSYSDQCVIPSTSATSSPLPADVELDATINGVSVSIQSLTSLIAMTNAQTSPTPGVATGRLQPFSTSNQDSRSQSRLNVSGGDGRNTSSFSVSGNETHVTSLGSPIHDYDNVSYIVSPFSLRGALVLDKSLALRDVLHTQTQSNRSASQKHQPIDLDQLPSEELSSNRSNNHTNSNNNDVATDHSSTSTLGNLRYSSLATGLSGSTTSALLVDDISVFVTPRDLSFVLAIVDDVSTNLVALLARPSTEDPRHHSHLERANKPKVSEDLIPIKDDDIVSPTQLPAFLFKVILSKVSIHLLSSPPASIPLPLLADVYTNYINAGALATGLAYIPSTPSKASYISANRHFAISLVLADVIVSIEPNTLTADKAVLGSLPPPSILLINADLAVVHHVPLTKMASNVYIPTSATSNDVIRIPDSSMSDTLTSQDVAAMYARPLLSLTHARPLISPTRFNVLMNFNTHVPHFNGLLYNKYPDEDTPLKNPKGYTEVPQTNVTIVAGKGMQIYLSDDFLRDLVCLVQILDGVAQTATTAKKIYRRISKVAGLPAHPRVKGKGGQPESTEKKGSMSGGTHTIDNDPIQVEKGDGDDDDNDSEVDGVIDYGTPVDPIRRKRKQAASDLTDDFDISINPKPPIRTSKTHPTQADRLASKGVGAGRDGSDNVDILHDASSFSLSIVVPEVAIFVDLLNRIEFVSQYASRVNNVHVDGTQQPKVLTIGGSSKDQSTSLPDTVTISKRPLPTGSKQYGSGSGVSRVQQLYRKQQGLPVFQTENSSSNAGRTTGIAATRARYKVPVPASLLHKCVEDRGSVYILPCYTPRFAFCVRSVELALSTTPLSPHSHPSLTVLQKRVYDFTQGEIIMRNRDRLLLNIAVGAVELWDLYKPSPEYIILRTEGSLLHKEIHDTSLPASSSSTSTSSTSTSTSSDSSSKLPPYRSTPRSAQDMGHSYRGIPLNKAPGVTATNAEAVVRELHFGLDPNDEPSVLFSLQSPVPVNYHLPDNYDIVTESVLPSTSSTPSSSSSPQPSPAVSLIDQRTIRTPQSGYAPTSLLVLLRFHNVYVNWSPEFMNDLFDFLFGEPMEWETKYIDETSAYCRLIDDLIEGLDAAQPRPTSSPPPSNVSSSTASTPTSSPILPSPRDRSVSRSSATSRLKNVLTGEVAKVLALDADASRKAVHAKSAYRLAKVKERARQIAQKRYEKAVASGETEATAEDFDELLDSDEGEGQGEVEDEYVDTSRDDAPCVKEVTENIAVQGVNHERHVARFMQFENAALPSSVSITPSNDGLQSTSAKTMKPQAGKQKVESISDVWPDDWRGGTLVPVSQWGSRVPYTCNYVEDCMDAELRKRRREWNYLNWARGREFVGRTTLIRIRVEVSVKNLHVSLIKDSCGPDTTLLNKYYRFTDVPDLSQLEKPTSTTRPTQQKQLRPNVSPSTLPPLSSLPRVMYRLHITSVTCTVALPIVVDVYSKRDDFSLYTDLTWSDGSEGQTLFMCVNRLGRYRRSSDETNDDEFKRAHHGILKALPVDHYDHELAAIMSRTGLGSGAGAAPSAEERPKEFDWQEYYSHPGKHDLLLVKKPQYSFPFQVEVSLHTLQVYKKSEFLTGIEPGNLDPWSLLLTTIHDEDIEPHFKRVFDIPTSDGPVPSLPSAPSSTTIHITPATTLTTTGPSPQLMMPPPVFSRLASASSFTAAHTLQPRRRTTSTATTASPAPSPAESSKGNGHGANVELISETAGNPIFKSPHIELAIRGLPTPPNFYYQPKTLSKTKSLESCTTPCLAAIKAGLPNKSSVFVNPFDTVEDTVMVSGRTRRPLIDYLKIDERLSMNDMNCMTNYAPIVQTDPLPRHFTNDFNATTTEEGKETGPTSYSSAVKSSVLAEPNVDEGVPLLQHSSIPNYDGIQFALKAAPVHVCHQMKTTIELADYVLNGIIASLTKLLDRNARGNHVNHILKSTEPYLLSGLHLLKELMAFVPGYPQPYDLGFGRVRMSMYLSEITCIIPSTNNNNTVRNGDAGGENTTTCMTDYTSSLLAHVKDVHLTNEPFFEAPPQFTLKTDDVMSGTQTTSSDQRELSAPDPTVGPRAMIKHGVGRAIDGTYLSPLHPKVKAAIYSTAQDTEIKYGGQGNARASAPKGSLRCDSLYVRFPHLARVSEKINVKVGSANAVVIPPLPEGSSHLFADYTQVDDPLLGKDTDHTSNIPRRHDYSLLNSNRLASNSAYFLRSGVPIPDDGSGVTVMRVNRKDDDITSHSQGKSVFYQRRLRAIRRYNKRRDAKLSAFRLRKHVTGHECTLFDYSAPLLPPLRKCLPNPSTLFDYNGNKFVVGEGTSSYPTHQCLTQNSCLIEGCSYQRQPNPHEGVSDILVSSAVNLFTVGDEDYVLRHFDKYFPADLLGDDPSRLKYREQLRSIFTSSTKWTRNANTDACVYARANVHYPEGHLLSAQTTSSVPRTGDIYQQASPNNSFTEQGTSTSSSGRLSAQAALQQFKQSGPSISTTNTSPMPSTKHVRPSVLSASLPLALFPGPLSLSPASLSVATSSSTSLPVAARIASSLVLSARTRLSLYTVALSSPQYIDSLSFIAPSLYAVASPTVRSALNQSSPISSLDAPSIQYTSYSRLFFPYFHAFSLPLVSPCSLLLHIRRPLCPEPVDALLSQRFQIPSSPEESPVPLTKPAPPIRIGVAVLPIFAITSPAPLSTISSAGDSVRFINNPFSRKIHVPNPLLTAPKIHLSKLRFQTLVRVAFNNLLEEVVKNNYFAEKYSRWPDEDDYYRNGVYAGEGDNHGEEGGTYDDDDDVDNDDDHDDRQHVGPVIKDKMYERAQSMRTAESTREGSRHGQTDDDDFASSALTTTASTTAVEAYDAEEDEDGLFGIEADRVSTTSTSGTSGSLGMNGVDGLFNRITASDDAPSDYDDEFATPETMSETEQDDSSAYTTTTPPTSQSTATTTGSSLSSVGGLSSLVRGIADLQTDGGSSSLLSPHLFPGSSPSASRAPLALPSYTGSTLPRPVTSPSASLASLQSKSGARQNARRTSSQLVSTDPCALEPRKLMHRYVS